MGEGLLLDVMRQGLLAGLMIAAPILGVALLTGLVVGLFQALTSIQEMTLTFVPKLATILATFWLSMGFMTLTLAEFFTATILPLVSR